MKNEKGSNHLKRLRVYRKAGGNYSPETVAKRREELEKATGAKLSALGAHALTPEKIQGNIEGFIGAAQVPVGIAGPIEVRGDHARGSFFVPMATTEGALVDSYTRGMHAISRAGGARTRVLNHVMHITPAFPMKDLDASLKLVEWVKANEKQIREKAEATTRNGKLLRIEPLILGRHVLLKFVFDPADAMGLNMINIATERACGFIQFELGLPRFYLRSNYSADKKSSASNFVSGYGKEVIVDVTIPKRVVSRLLNTSPEELQVFWKLCAQASMKSGVTGMQAHLANGLAGIYIACGQDVAQIVNSATGILNLEVNAEGDLYASLHLPNLVMGTIGGGMGLPTQRECLEMIGCYGSGQALKFAEIIAATLLAGELSICAALASGEFLKIHEIKHGFTKAQMEA